MRTITVRCKDGSYPVAFGASRTERLRSMVGRTVGQGRLVLICDAQWYALHGERFRTGIGVPRKRITTLVLPRGEQAKSVRTLNDVYDLLLAEGIERDDFILACGGGVTSDLAGYVAATILRGVRWGVVPTTPVGMVDASIGGKTGINHGSGKNLIGAFWPPEFVWIDPEYLHTVPPRHMVAGLGELVKAAGLAGGALLKATLAFLRAGDLYDLGKLAPLIRQAATLKASIVSQDERDHGVRRQLNYGHTFAHAIEQSQGYRGLLHGEAVILGMASALRLGELLGQADVKRLAPFATAVGRCLELVPKRKIQAEAVVAGMANDKKRRRGENRFVLLERPGRVRYVEGIPPAVVRKALEQMLAGYRQTGGKRG